MTHVAQLIAGIEEQLPKWRSWFPSEASSVEIPRCDLLTIVEAAKDAARWKDQVVRLTDLVRQHEVDRDRADAYEADLTAIGQAIGCGHLGDGLARCVRDVVGERDELRRRVQRQTEGLQ